MCFSLRGRVMSCDTWEQQSREMSKWECELAVLHLLYWEFIKYFEESLLRKNDLKTLNLVIER